MSEANFDRARSIAREWKKKNWQSISNDPNCLGAGFGRRIADGQLTDEPALIIYVATKIPQQFLPQNRILPRRAYVGRDMFEVDVVETGFIYPFALTDGESGLFHGSRIGHSNVSGGTLGCLVVDKADNSRCILSTNHVIANQNAANVGDPTVEVHLRGRTGRRVATLKRFVEITADRNTVDAAIAELDDADYVVDQMKGNLMPTASTEHPAVGLLFAGSPNRTFMNPIGDVLNQLNVKFPAGPDSITKANINMNVEKVGSATAYTTATVAEVDVTLSVPYDFGVATFENQIATTWMSNSGDSGAVVYAGGTGGVIGISSGRRCPPWLTAESFLKKDLKTEAVMTQEFRDKYLRETKVGRWGLEVLELNEKYLTERFNSAKTEDADRDYAKELYQKYDKPYRQVLADPEAEEHRFLEEHLADMKLALERATKYLNDDEADAAYELIDLIEASQDATPREVLTALNDEEVLKGIQDIVGRILPTPT